MNVGTIISINYDRGFGFLETDKGDVFFHFRALPPGVEFDSSLVGQRFTFEVAKNPKLGKHRATNMRAA